MAFSRKSDPFGPCRRVYPFEKFDGGKLTVVAGYRDCPLAIRCMSQRLIPMSANSRSLKLESACTSTPYRFHLWMKRMIGVNIVLSFLRQNAGMLPHRDLASRVKFLGIFYGVL